MKDRTPEEIEEIIKLVHEVLENPDHPMYKETSAVMEMVLFYFGDKKMSYKHIIGDLYEFTDVDDDLTTLRLKNVISFNQTSEDELSTVLYLGGIDPYIIIKIKYAEFKELMKVYVENEMLSNAFTGGYPVYQYSLDGSYTPPEQSAPKEARTGDYPDLNYHITTEGEKKK